MQVRMQVQVPRSKLKLDRRCKVEIFWRLAVAHSNAGGLSALREE